jgi:hypothetical protein
MLAAALVAGCQQMETGMAVTHGMLRFEPHPLHADSVRLLTIVSPVALDPLGRGTPDGNRTVVRNLLGEQCADAQIIEEGRIRVAAMGSGEFAALRVICPAARVR